MKLFLAMKIATTFLPILLLLTATVATNSGGVVLDTDGDPLITHSTYRILSPFYGGFGSITSQPVQPWFSPCPLLEVVTVGLSSSGSSPVRVTPLEKVNPSGEINLSTKVSIGFQRVAPLPLRCPLRTVWAVELEIFSGRQCVQLLPPPQSAASELVNNKFKIKRLGADPRAYKLVFVSDDTDDDDDGANQRNLGVVSLFGLNLLGVAVEPLTVRFQKAYPKSAI